MHAQISFLLCQLVFYVYISIIFFFDYFFLRKLGKKIVFAVQKLFCFLSQTKN